MNAPSAGLRAVRLFQIKLPIAMFRRAEITCFCLWEQRVRVRDGSGKEKPASWAAAAARGIL